MKVNFQETIKQKTDKELEIISKDYAFYSEEERLIVLNELKSRNSLSKELLMDKEHIESSIEKDVSITEAIKLKKQIYKGNAIFVGAFIGGPLVAGYLMTENFKVFNEIGKINKIWNYAVLWTIIIFIIILFIPANPFNYLLTAIIAFSIASFAHFMVERFQAKNISAYIALGGEPFGWFRTIGVTIIGV